MLCFVIAIKRQWCLECILWIEGFAKTKGFLLRRDLHVKKVLQGSSVVSGCEEHISASPTSLITAGRVRLCPLIPSVPTTTRPAFNFIDWKSIIRRSSPNSQHVGAKSQKQPLGNPLDNSTSYFHFHVEYHLLYKMLKYYFVCHHFCFSSEIIMQLKRKSD